MRRCAALLVALAVALLAAVETASAQQWASQFNTLSHNYGNVARGSKAEYSFVFRNTSPSDVHINAVTTSCGCTRVRLASKEANALDPNGGLWIKRGKTGLVVSDFNTLGFDGAHSATITVHIDQPNFAQVRLQVNGFIRKDLVFDPGKIEIGTVDAGKPYETRVAIHYAGRSDWKVVDVRSRNTNFEVELNKQPSNDGRVDYDMLVRLKRTAPPGYINDRLVIVTNDADNKLVPISVEGNVAANLTVSPNSLHLGTVKPGDKVTKQIAVRGKTPFKILRIECANKDFKFASPTFETPTKASMLHLVPVVYTGSATQGIVVAKIRVITDGGSDLLPPVTAQANVVAPDPLRQGAAPQTDVNPPAALKDMDVAPKKLAPNGKAKSAVKIEAKPSDSDE